MPIWACEHIGIHRNRLESPEYSGTPTAPNKESTAHQSGGDWVGSLALLQCGYMMCIKSLEALFIRLGGARTTLPMGSGGVKKV